MDALQVYRDYDTAFSKNQKGLEKLREQLKELQDCIDFVRERCPEESQFKYYLTYEDIEDNEPYNLLLKVWKEQFIYNWHC